MKGKGKDKGQSNFLQIMDKKGHLPQDLPRWITGDLANTDQDDYFISEVESEKRIFIILQIMITFLLITCCILVEKCFNNSSFSVKRRIIHASNGKYNQWKFLNIFQIWLRIILLFEFIRNLQFWIRSATVGHSHGQWFSVGYKIKQSIQNNREKFTDPIAQI